MTSLVAILEEKFAEAFRCMESMKIPHEPAVMIYLARHYSYMGATDSAVKTLKRAAQSGFICAPETLGSDSWLSAARAQPQFGSVLAEAVRLVDQARSILKRSGVKMMKS